MPSHPVDVVFFARYTISNFRALYKRFTGPPATYTKDYFQLADQAENVMKEALGFAGDPVPVTYAWPGGGTHPGEFLFSNDRAHLSWTTGGPKPWRIGDVLDGVASIEGDTTKATPAEADAEYERIRMRGQEPWLVGVMLYDQPDKMHVRVYFQNPPPGFEDRRIDELPEQVRAAINALPANAGTGAIRGKGPARARAAVLVDQIEDALARSPNVLLIGPPGTGKTVALEDLLARYSTVDDRLYFDPEQWGATALTFGEVEPDQRCEALVFHPSYSYENFVAGLYPKSGGGAGTELEAVPGPLLRLAHWVGKSRRMALLIIDEFNRGPAAAIFGDALALLDKDKRSTVDKKGAYIQRPYPDFQMRVAEEYASFGAAGPEEIGKQVTLPSEVSIIAAMNSTDRSVAPLDAALRRRFHVIRVLPDYEVLAARFGLTLAEINAAVFPPANDPAASERKNILILAVRVLRAINERVGFCLGEDFLLGHALLWGLGDSTDESALPDLAAAMDGFVVATLRTTFLDQDDVLAAVLGIPDVAPKPATPADARLLGYWQNPPPGLDKIASRRLVLHSLEALPAEAQLASLAALAKA